LQKSFTSELEEQDLAWAAWCAGAAEETLSSGGRETELRAEVEALRHELSAARAEEDEALEAGEHRTAELRGRLARSRAELDEGRAACRRLQGECEAASQEEYRSIRSLEAAEAQAEEAEKARERGLRELIRRREAVHEHREEELVELRREHDAEAARLHAQLLQSLNGVASSSVGGHDETLGVDVAERAAAAAARAAGLRERARRQLGLADPP